MGKLCERPGCSESASVAYGMRPEDLVFWLDQLVEGAEADGGVLCRRHADSMVVPRNWTLNDLRDPDLHLFRPPDATAVDHGNSTRHLSRSTTDVPLDFGVDDVPDPTTADTDAGTGIDTDTGTDTDTDTAPTPARTSAAARSLERVGQHRTSSNLGRRRSTHPMTSMGCCPPEARSSPAPFAATTDRGASR